MESVTSMVAPYNFVEEARQLVMEITLRRLVQTKTDAGVNTELLNFILNSIVGQRNYLIADNATAAMQWSYIRKHANVVDFVIAGTNELIMRSSNWPIVTKTAALAVSSCSHIDSVIDADLQNRLPALGALAKLTDANPWLVFLYLLGTLEHDNFIPATPKAGRVIPQ